MALNKQGQKPNRVLLDLAHFSMQFKDSRAQQEADVSKIFTRGYAWVTGTEAGQDPLKSLLRKEARLNNYTFHAYKSNWIAVNKQDILRGSYRTGGDTIIENDLVVGRGHDTNVVKVKFEHPTLGKITVFCSHYPTMGSPTRKPNPNLKWTKKLAGAIAAKAKKAGAGHGLVFYGGDQNIVDRTNDTFFGHPLTSAWDELGRYENTGHGNIDVIASYDRDGRVKARYVRALDDSELKMFIDHFPVEAGYEVRVLS